MFRRFPAIKEMMYWPSAGRTRVVEAAPFVAFACMKAAQDPSITALLFTQVEPSAAMPALEKVQDALAGLSKYPYGGCSVSGSCISNEALVTVTDVASFTVPLNQGRAAVRVRAGEGQHAVAAVAFVAALLSATLEESLTYVTKVLAVEKRAFERKTLACEVLLR